MANNPFVRAYLEARSLFARSVLWTAGWKFKGKRIQFPAKFIAFGEPHTHYLDFVMMLLFAWSYQVPKLRYPMKRQYFFPVVRVWLRWMGAIPVDTSVPQGLVDQLSEQMRKAERLVLHIPPSGTRKRTERWRSGFYHIARNARVPILPAFLDASTRTYGYGPLVWLTGDVKRDMDIFRAFYADKRGFVPENESVVRLKEEDLEELPLARDDDSPRAASA